MKYRWIKVTNNFHNTEARVRVAMDWRGDHGIAWVSKRTARRLHNELCGSNDCACGGGMGNRGPQSWMPLGQDEHGNLKIALTEED